MDDPVGCGECARRSRAPCKDGISSGYDLKRIFDTSVRHFWPADQGQIYRTLARLTENGVARYDYEYWPNGPCNPFMFFEPDRGWRHLAVTDHRTLLDFAQQLKRLVDEAYPEADVVRVILDNLNTPRAAALYEAFPPAEARRILKRRLSLILKPQAVGLAGVLTGLRLALRRGRPRPCTSACSGLVALSFYAGTPMIVARVARDLVAAASARGAFNVILIRPLGRGIALWQSESRDRPTPLGWAEAAPISAARQGAQRPGLPNRLCGAWPKERG